MSSHGSVTTPTSYQAKPSTSTAGKDSDSSGLESKHTKTQELDPKIWSQLPHDLILNTIEHLSGSDLVNWSCVSRAIFPFVISRLWRRLAVSFYALAHYEEMAGLLDEWNNPESHIWRKTVVQCLLQGGRSPTQKLILVFAGLQNLHVANYIYKPNLLGNFGNTVGLSAQVSSNYVRELIIERATRRIVFKDRRRGHDRTLAKLLKSLPGLIKCTLGEPDLRSSTLRVVLQARSLRSLDIRFVTRWSRPYRFTFIPKKKELDFKSLSTLECLKSLRIDCLTVNETKGLAESISVLTLETLELNCHRWELWGSGLDRQWKDDLKGFTSPLILLVDNLLTQTAEGFPKTLKRLVLSDRFPRKIPLLHQRIMTAVAQCQDLETMEISNRIDKDRYENLDGQFLYAYGRRLVVQSWQQLESDEEPDFCFRYLSPTGTYLSTSVLAKPVNPILSPLVRTLDAMAEQQGTSNTTWATMLYNRDPNVPKNQILVIPCGCTRRYYPLNCSGCKSKARPRGKDLPSLEEAFKRWETKYSGEDGYPYDSLTVLKGRGLWAKQMEAGITGERPIVSTPVRRPKRSLRQSLSSPRI